MVSVLRFSLAVAISSVCVPVPLFPIASKSLLNPAVRLSVTSAKSVSALKAATSDPIATPRLVLAVDASLAPVPPSATVMSVIPVTEPPVIDTELLA